MKDEVIARISPMIENFIKSDSLFEKLDKDAMVTVISTLIFENYLSDKIRAITDDDLTKRVRNVLGVEAMSKLLSDFTPEEIAEFEAAIPKR